MKCEKDGCWEHGTYTMKHDWIYPLNLCPAHTPAEAAPAPKAY